MKSQLKYYLPAIILFVFFAFLYIYTAAPGIYDGDSGEIAAAVNTLGLAHPTGFPLYMLTGKLFTLLIPWGEIAFRLNILSALLTAVAVVLFFNLLRALNLSLLASFFASLILGLGRNTIWHNAGDVSVYALSFFISIILLNLFIKWQTTRERKYLFWYAFIFGLSLGSHALMIIMSIPLLLMLWEVFKFRQVKNIIYSLILAILPLTQYLYLWFAYKRNAIVNWGDLSSFQGFINYVTQRDWAYKIANRDNTATFLATLIKFLSSEFTIIFFVVAILGLILLFKKNKGFVVAISSIAVSNILIMFFYGNNQDLYILSRYIFFVYVAFAITLAYAFDVLFKKLGVKREKLILVVVIISIFLGFQLKTAFAINNKHNNSVTTDLAENILRSVEEDSLLFTEGDIRTGSLWYLQSLGKRGDVVIIVGNFIARDWYIKNMQLSYPDVFDANVLKSSGYNDRLIKIFEDNISKRKIYTTFIDWESKDARAENFQFIPIGVIYRVVPREVETIDILNSSRQWQNYDLGNIKTNYPDIQINGIVFYYLVTLNNTGMAYFRNGFFDEAEILLRKALSLRNHKPIEANLKEVLRKSNSP